MATIEQNIERIANALERVAKILEQPMLQYNPGEASPEATQQAKEMAADLAAQNPPAEDNVTDMPDREAIIAELAKLGVKPAGRQSTKYLKMLLEKKIAEGAKPEAPKAEEAPEEKSAIDVSAMKAKAEEKPEPKKEEKKPEPKKEITLDDAREALKKYAMKMGTDKTMAVLGKFNAKKISDVPAEKLGELVKALG